MSDPYFPPQATPPPPGLSSEERTWGLIAHLSALSGLVTGGLGVIIGPLVVWLIKKDTLPFASGEAKEALNFNITWFIVAAALSLLAFLLMFIFIGFLLFPVIGIMGIAWLVLSIIAAVRANEGRPYKYPLTIRFIK